MSPTMNNTGQVNGNNALLQHPLAKVLEAYETAKVADDTKNKIIDVCHSMLRSPRR